MTTQRIFAVLLFIGLLTGAALTQSRPGYPNAQNRGPYRPPNNAPNNPRNQPAQPVQESLPAKRYINPPTKAGQAPFSDAVQVDNTLYLSGRLGIDPRTGQVPSDVKLEVRILMEGMRQTLAEAGMTMDDLVSVQVYCTDLALYEQFNSIYRGYFTRAVPARAVMGVNKLLRGARFEIQGTAVLAQ
ncbi:MAG: RidA family protein [Acidobacteria bacterium]|nr:RidA family protein [Acidobacteriota bacterium]MBI3423933.1 RidA family protein [Acidobacteriota bacterium]